MAAQCGQFLPRGLGGAAGVTLDTAAGLALGLRGILRLGQFALEGAQAGLGLGQSAGQDLVFRPQFAQLVGQCFALRFGSDLGGAQFGQGGGGGACGLLGGAAGAVGIGQAAQLAGGVIGRGFGPGQGFGQLVLHAGQAALGA